jgi:nucleotide-binding universal stress UspA family protein
MPVQADSRGELLDMYQRIIVPLDGSELAETVLPEAKKMARQIGAPVHLLRVSDPVESPWYGTMAAAMDYAAIQSVVENQTTEATGYLQEVAKRLNDEGITVETEARQGRASREIVAATKPGDVIVVASRGRSGITRWLLGSVAEDVLRHATVLVLLVRASDSSDDDKSEATT